MMFHREHRIEDHSWHIVHSKTGITMAVIRPYFDGRYLYALDIPSMPISIALTGYVTLRDAQRTVISWLETPS